MPATAPAKRHAAAQPRPKRQPPAQPRPRHPAATPEPGDTLTRLPVALIDPSPWNPRRFPKKPDAQDQSLAASLLRHGVLEPLLVRPAAGGRYQLDAVQRYRAACAAAQSLAAHRQAVADASPTCRA